MSAFSALADPTRCSIFEMLAGRGRLPAGEICSHFSISPPAVSQHLKVLREARLVRMEKRAQQRIYSINPSGIDEMDQWLQKTRALWERRFDALDEYLKQEMAKEKEAATDDN